MTYTVLWSRQDQWDISPVTERKEFENQYQANWFANHMKKRYNWVMCVETKNLKEY